MASDDAAPAVTRALPRERSLAEHDLHIGSGITTLDQDGDRRFADADLGPQLSGVLD
jgi:hypothetical protein